MKQPRSTQKKLLLLCIIIFSSGYCESNLSTEDLITEIYAIRNQELLFSITNLVARCFEKVGIKTFRKIVNDNKKRIIKIKESIKNEPDIKKLKKCLDSVKSLKKLLLKQTLFQGFIRSHIAHFMYDSYLQALNEIKSEIKYRLKLLQKV